MNRTVDAADELKLLQAQLELAQMMLEQEARKRITLEKTLDALEREHPGIFRRN